jgi:hypothetical protein
MSSLRLFRSYNGHGYEVLFATHGWCVNVLLISKLTM